MFRKKSIAIIASVLLIPLLACNLLSPAVVGGGGPTQDPAVATAAIQTQVALLVASTSAAQTALANVLAATQAALPTNTPEFTFTPSLTPTAAFTPTPTIPMVSVSVATNCRSGPTTNYDLLGILKVGETAEVVGRSTLTDTMIIKLPSNPGITCWLWAQNATVVGDISKLPLINVPASPTPAPSFNVAYSAVEVCGGGFFGILFKITNNGAITWESNRVTATDQTTTENNTIDRNDFANYSGVGCAPVSSDLNLAPGEVGNTSSLSFSANPAGHSFKATIRVCSLDGMAGVCMDKTITFTP